MRSEKFLITKLFLLFVLTYNSISCGNRKVESEISNWERDFEVELQIVTEGFEDGWNWIQPRVARTGNDKEYSLIMQPWYYSISDYIGPYFEMRSMDGGESWSNPVSLADSLGDKYKGDTLIRIADVNIQYHKKSNTILGVGGVCYYSNGYQIGMAKQTCYFTYNRNTHKYGPYKILQMPDDKIFAESYPGCSQWSDLPNGDILQPFRMWDEERGQFYCTVARCSFDGNILRFIDHGNILRFNRGRGLYEPSLIEYNGKYYLTLRNDINGLVSVSKDGLHYSKPKEWRFDTDSLINSVNTQQHWVRSPWGLYLVYTSSNRKESQNVIRGRAPLYIALFDEKKMCLIKETERVLVPNHGAQLGNFGAFDLDESHSWVVTSELTTPETQLIGNNNARVYIAKIHWF